MSSIGGSEVQFQHQLKYARIERPRDGSKGRGAETRVRGRKGRRVGNIERFDAEFRAKLFCEREDFGEHDIEGLIPGTHDGIARTAAQRELGRLGKRRGVEPARSAPLFRGQHGVSGAVRPLDAKSGERVEIGRLGYYYRTSRLQPHNSGQLPAPGQRVLPAVQSPAATLAQRKFPDEGSGEHLWNTAGRMIFLQTAIVAVGRLERGRGTGQDGRIKDGAGVVDQF